MEQESHRCVKGEQDLPGDLTRETTHVELHFPREMSHHQLEQLRGVDDLAEAATRCRQRVAALHRHHTLGGARAQSSGKREKNLIFKLRNVCFNQINTTRGRL